MKGTVGEKQNLLLIICVLLCSSLRPHPLRKGYELKQKNPAMRRNVLFDDSTRDLRLDFSQGSEWKSVNPEEAKKTLRSCRPSRARKSSVSANELEELLGRQEDEDMSGNEEY